MSLLYACDACPRCGAQTSEGIQSTKAPPERTVNSDFLFKDEGPLIWEVIRFFCGRVMDPAHFDAVVQALNKGRQLNPMQQTFIQQGKFTLDDFAHYWCTVLQPGGGLFKNVIVEELLRRMRDCHLLSRSEFLISRGIYHYELNTSLAEFLIKRDALENGVFEAGYLVEKYSKAVLNLSVTDAEGDLWGGTGFLLGKRDLVITNKHVVEEDAHHRPRVFASGREIDVHSVKLDESEDLAALLLSEKVDARPLFPFQDWHVLEEVLTMGYPRIPLAREAAMVAHRGEINGHVSTSHGERLIFSAKTAPGNSGGPLVNRSGLVVGIVAEDLQSKGAEENRVQPYFAAIPCTRIAGFLQKILSESSSSTGNEGAA